MCDDGGRLYQNECVIGTGGWLKAVSTMPKHWLSLKALH